MTADDPDLRRRRAVGMDQPLVVDAARGKFIEQALAVRVVADIARDADVRPEERQVVRDVCRAAELRVTSPE